MSIKKKEVMSHPRIVKLISVVTGLFMLGTFVVNGYVMAAGYQLDWGFSPDKTTPNIQAVNIGNTTLNIYVPAHVYNNKSILPFGFDVKSLQFNFTILNSSRDVLTSNASIIGDIPFGTGREFNVTIMSLNAGLFLPLLNGTMGAIYFKIEFHVEYAFSSTTLDVEIKLPGGLSFT
ncbi:MAG: hypothetical protein GYA24_15360 [Candidatus Lokiarchaeota archaeon]|nr:hypothetical protein [Candidatus Lokiarchaeota archaeon]